MKTAVAVALFAISWRALGQGTFQNLDFESATITASPAAPYPNFVSASSAIPDWTASIGGVDQSEISYNSTTIGTANVSLLGPTWSTVNPGIISGSYSVILQAGGDPQNATVPVSVSIGQNGTVPANTQSLQFDAWNPDNALGVSFDGDSLTIFPLSTFQTASGQQVTRYGVNISQFAGQSGELDFSSIFNQSYPSVVFDDISFSPIGVAPEPSSVALMGIGAAVFAAYRRFARKRT